MSVWTLGGVISLVLLADSLAACASSTRDVVPETRDVTVPTSASAATDGGVDPASDYAHLSKRRHGVVALAEARGFPPGDAERAIDALADEFESCATAREAEGKLVKGAARVVARIDSNGNVDGLNVRAAPGPAVAANLLLCIVAPLKAASFGPAPSSAAPRGFAIEAEWGPLAPGPAAAP